MYRSKFSPFNILLTRPMRYLAQQSPSSNVACLGAFERDSVIASQIDRRIRFLVRRVLWTFASCGFLSGIKLVFNYQIILGCNSHELVKYCMSIVNSIESQFTKKKKKHSIESCRAEVEIVVAEIKNLTLAFRQFSIY